MNGYRKDIALYEPDEVKGYLDTARVMVEELGLPDTLHKKAFELAVGMLSRKQVTMTPSAGVILGSPLGEAH